MPDEDTVALVVFGGMTAIFGALMYAALPERERKAIRELVKALGEGIAEGIIKAKKEVEE